ncbi:MAG TPA: acyltransferase family protein [Acidobacteriaceae bacterium]
MLRTRSTLAYRTDIDGLRAVAVLLVVFFHLKLLKVWGGFIGVDIFFVISGFLISSVILKEITESRFSLSSFYQRRIRRILPALVLSTAVTAAAAAVFLFPSELESFARSLLAASFSVSNFFFWLHSGYFAAPASEQPLLHTWSLAVEEQFYIFFPLFLLGVRRFFPGRFKLAVVLLASASFALSAVGVYRFTNATFYLPLTRAWELLLGTMLSLQLFPALTTRAAREAAATAGLLMILIPAFRYEVSVPFPGLAALPPCLGAALIIAAGQHGTSFVGRLLSTRPVVFIGLISYSLYLWHWPIIVFQKMGMLQPPGAAEHTVKAIVFLLSLLVATLSWRYIERPFRNGGLSLSAATTFRFATASTLALALAAALLLASHGFPSRYSAQQVQVASYADQDTYATYRIGSCYINTTVPYDRTKCLQRDASRKNYLLFGDSHAAHLWYGLAEVFPQVNFLEAASSGCEPLLTHRIFDTGRCNDIMDYVLHQYLPTHHVDKLLLAARWEQGDLDQLGPTLAYLKTQGIAVVLFGPIMQYDSPLPRLLAISLKHDDAALPLRHELTRYRALDERMALLAATQWKVPYVSFFKLLCPDNACERYAAQNVPLQVDYGHLSREGSVFVAQRLKQSGLLDAAAPAQQLPAAQP